MPPPHVSDTDLIERDPGMVHAAVDGEAVMMSIAQGSYFGLNSVGADIWALLETPTSIDEIQRHLLAEYEVDESECRREIVRFVDELLRLGIARRCSAR
jgi:Coenzyme PQQ synthesis protein D (PqqD)